MEILKSSNEMEALVTSVLPEPELIVNTCTNGETQPKTSITNSPTDEKTAKASIDTEPPSKNQADVSQLKSPAAGEDLLKSKVTEEDQVKSQAAGEDELKSQEAEEAPANNNSENDSNGEQVEDELDKLAMDELLKEAKRGAERARDMGPVGWLQSSVPKPNKRFLNNTVVSTLKYLHSPPKKQLHNADWNIHNEWYKSRSSRPRNDDKLEQQSVQSHQQPKESRSPVHRKSRSPVHRKSRSPTQRESRSPTHRQSRSPAHRSSKRKHSSKSHRSSDKKAEKSTESSSKSSEKKKSHKRSHKKSKKRSKKSHSDD